MHIEYMCRHHEHASIYTAAVHVSLQANRVGSSFIARTKYCVPFCASERIHAHAYACDSPSFRFNSPKRLLSSSLTRLPLRKNRLPIAENLLLLLSLVYPNRSNAEYQESLEPPLVGVCLPPIYSGASLPTFRCNVLRISWGHTTLHRLEESSEKLLF